ncbi:hypothetical protein MOKP125_34320 [Mycobacterium avium subsp. hominissuis]
MAHQHLFRAIAQQGDIEYPGDVGGHPDHVRVVRRLAVGELGKRGQRIQALLQRAQRHHVLDVGGDIGFGGGHAVPSRDDDQSWVTAARSEADNPEVLIGSNRVSAG